MSATIQFIAGPVVQVKNLTDAKINDIVYVGKEELIGEVVELRDRIAFVQVYEETDGLCPGEPVVNSGMPLSAELGPGLLAQTYDGILRPLDSIAKEQGAFIARGLKLPTLDRKKKWDFVPTVKNGDVVSAGMILGEVKETQLITHKVMVPHGMQGKISGIKKGTFTVTQTICSIDKKTVTMMQKWPVRVPRPFVKKTVGNIPLFTGRRICDTFFPVIKGGQAATPGPFGSGKTVLQQSLAKFSDAQIIIYIGCGERGNEMTEVLSEFPELLDPISGKPLMERTVLIANTSNMPVAAREASIYTGVTVAEYFRDQGYDVALMADSTSRWAEAMREISGRLQEMPGEEGYPSYLASKIAQFYERAGIVENIHKKNGSITIVGAVSPPGGDFAEPVTQQTLKIIKAFWALDAPLANKKHYPAINWLTSYSQYADSTDSWFDEHVASDWSVYRRLLMDILQREAELIDLSQLIGKDSLPKQEQFILLIGRIIREDLLQQDAFDENDETCPFIKQYWMMKNVVDYYTSKKELEIDIDAEEKSSAFTDLANMKFCDNDKSESILKKLHSKILKTGDNK
ncbi:MAG: V/A-type H+-transporting ATPase subunit A [Candidatus Woesearchaeota archaeon]|jgi:V/A-type H+-transporting ATPase subunit A